MDREAVAVQYHGCLIVDLYNEARPHMALGPGVPDPPPAAVQPATQLSRHQIGGRLVLRVKSILGGLHHEYSRAPQLA